MDCSWPESSPFDRRRAADELRRGREFAQQLQTHLRRSSTGCGGGTAASDELLSRILASFSNTISIMNRCGSESDDTNGSIVDSPEKSEDSCKNSSPVDRRGSYKRRKNSHSWAQESSSLVDDGHAWRKYGQKSILNAKFPRSYYRCTHKVDQSCKATKQVQRLQDHPPKFRTTYYNLHTCNNFLHPSEIVLGSPDFDDSCAHLLSFDTTTPVAVATVVKKELVVPGMAAKGEEDVACSLPDYMSAGPSSPDHFSDVLMAGCVVDFDDDVLNFDF